MTKKMTIEEAIKKQNQEAVWYYDMVHDVRRRKTNTRKQRLRVEGLRPTDGDIK